MTSDSRSQDANALICRRCRTTSTIEHNGGRWCPRCGVFTTPPDLRHTAHIPTTESRRLSPFQALQPRPDAPRCSSCLQPVDIFSGIYDDGEWLCGACF